MQSAYSTPPKTKEAGMVHVARATISARRPHSSASYVTTTPPLPSQNPYRPYGKAEELLYSHEPEVLLAGPAGTGKTRGCLEKLYFCAAKYPGIRSLMVRKTRQSLTQSAMVTWESKVLPARTPVYFHTTDQEYRFPNGSVIVVGGLDKPTKIMSSEYDMIYVAESTELNIEDWESLTTRLRNAVMPYQQLIADCNPGAPSHWLKHRSEDGSVRLLESRYEDNPMLWDHARGDWTERGALYIAQLDKLTGVRYLRLRKGIWAAAEGMVYDSWDPAVHLIDRFDIPTQWPRYRVIDFGFTNPFCCQWWAVDGDGRLYMYRELYGTGRIVEDWASDINFLSVGEKYVATIADHDAEDRATLERRGIKTEPAIKEISPGIQAVQARLRKAGDNRPRIYFLRDSLVSRDTSLAERGLPCCTVEEFESYVWPQGVDGKPLKEEPVDKDNHGMDGTRYMVAERDLERGTGRASQSNYALDAPKRHETRPYFEDPEDEDYG